MFGMANPEVLDFGGGWFPLTALLLAAVFLVHLKLNPHADSNGDKS